MSFGYNFMFIPRFLRFLCHNIQNVLTLKFLDLSKNNICTHTFQYSKPGAVNDSQKRCVHFYACICAFASDEKLSEEFSYYINLDSHGLYFKLHHISLTCKNTEIWKCSSCKIRHNGR